MMSLYNLNCKNKLYDLFQNKDFKKKIESFVV